MCHIMQQQSTIICKLIFQQTTLKHNIRIPHFKNRIYNNNLAERNVKIYFELFFRGRPTTTAPSTIINNSPIISQIGIVRKTSPIVKLGVESELVRIEFETCPELWYNRPRLLWHIVICRRWTNIPPDICTIPDFLPRLCKAKTGHNHYHGGKIPCLNIQNRKLEPRRQNPEK
jgi:hypothetical protein